MDVRANYPVTTPEPADERALRELFEGLLEDWGRGDSYAYGSRFTEDADYVAFDGTHTRGREEISASHQRLFDEYLRGTRLTGRIRSVKLLAPGVALVHATGGTISRGKSEPSPERVSIQTLVAVKRDGGWRFAAFHNARVRPITGGLSSFLVWALTDRLWKIFAPRKASDA